MNQMVEQSYPFTTEHIRMIERRASCGYRADESAEMLDELLRSLSGDNLAHALVFNEFATERLAYMIAND